MSSFFASTLALSAPDGSIADCKTERAGERVGNSSEREVRLAFGIASTTATPAPCSAPPATSAGGPGESFEDLSVAREDYSDLPNNDARRFDGARHSAASTAPKRRYGRKRVSTALGDADEGADTDTDTDADADVNLNVNVNVNVNVNSVITNGGGSVQCFDLTQDSEPSVPSKGEEYVNDGGAQIESSPPPPDRRTRRKYGRVRRTGLSQGYTSSYSGGDEGGGGDDDSYDDDNDDDYQVRSDGGSNSNNNSESVVDIVDLT